METTSHNVAVGLFVLAGLLTFVVVTVWLSGGGQIGYALYQANFAGPVAGLASGTPVRYNGIDVGHVSKVDFDPDDPKQVVALLQVQPKLSIRADSVAIVDSEGLTGGTFIEIEGGTREAPILTPQSGQPYPVIASRPSSFQQIKTDAPRLLNGLNMAADRASDLLNEQNRKALAKTLANLTIASDRLNQTLASTDEAAKKIDDAAKKFGRMSDDIGNAVTESKAQIKESAAQINEAFASADLAAKRVDRLSANVDDVVTSSKTQIADGVGQLDQLLGQSRSMVESITRLSDDIQRQPTTLLFGDRRQGYKPK
jgi:phospholipid/cholesterol/gamma-HCH transport system substrate-binding protein